MGRPKKDGSPAAPNAPAQAELLPWEGPVEVPQLRNIELRSNLSYFVNELIPWMDNPRVSSIRAQARALMNDIDDRIALDEYQAAQREKDELARAGAD